MPPLMMDRLLEKYLQYFPTGFIPAESCERLYAVARQLPPLAGSILECHLGQAVPRFDYALGLVSTDGGREVLAGLHPAFRLARMDHPIWQRITAFSHAWLEPNSLLARGVKEFSLEFDLLPENPANAFIPAIFFDVNRQDHLDSTHYWTIITTALTQLRGSPLPTGLLDTLAHTLSKLPATIRRYYVGLMLSRNIDVLRLCLIGLARTQIEPCLEAIGWQGDQEKIRTALNLAVNATQMIVDLDIGHVIHDRVGLEIYFRGQQHRQKWAAFFDQLVRAGLCTDDERRAILYWRGLERIDTLQAPIFQYISQSAGKSLQWLVRQPSHVKLVCDAAAPLYAKAYLYMSYR